MGGLLFATICAAAVRSAIVGGIFYGFSSFVMKALARIAAQQGVAAMNAINVVVINPGFMLPFLGTALISGVLAASSIFWWDQPGSTLSLVAAVLYLFGVVGITLAFNQPMNLRLAALEPARALDYWPRYTLTWVRWNHARTAASLLSAALFVTSLLVTH